MTRCSHLAGLLWGSNILISDFLVCELQRVDIYTVFALMLICELGETVHSRSHELNIVSRLMELEIHNPDEPSAAN